MLLSASGSCLFRPAPLSAVKIAAYFSAHGKRALARNRYSIDAGRGISSELMLIAVSTDFDQMLLYVGGRLCNSKK